MSFIKKRPIVGSAKASTSIFRKVSDEVIKKNIDNIGKGGEFDSYIKSEFPKYAIKDNTNNFNRIIPPRVDDPNTDFMKKIVVHEYFGGDGGYLCISKLFGQKCGLCGKYVEARMSDNEKLAKALRPRDKYIFQVLDMGKEPQDEGVMVLVAPPTLRDMILRQCMHPRDGSAQNVSDPDLGQEVIYYREKKSKFEIPKYTSVQLGDVVPIGPGSEFFEIIDQQLVHFDELLVIPTEEEIEEISRYIVTTVKDEPEAKDEEESQDRVTDRSGSRGTRSFRSPASEEGTRRSAPTTSGRVLRLGVKK